MHLSDPQSVAVVAACAPRWCVAVPPPGPGVCAICSAGAPPGRPTCTTCRHLAGASSIPLRPVVVLSLAPAGSGIYRLVVGAKRAPPPAMALRASMLAELVAGYLARHARCMAPGGRDRWDRVCAVPSLRARAGPHPLERVVERLTGPGPPAYLAGSVGWMSGALTRHRHPGPPAGSSLGHVVLRPSSAVGRLRRGLAVPDAFVADPAQVVGARVLLIDDVYTTGAHVHSAIAGLLQAGARSVDALVIARRIDARRPENAALLHRPGSPPPRWSWERCGLCGSAGPDRQPGIRRRGSESAASGSAGTRLSGPDRRGAASGPR